MRPLFDVPPPIALATNWRPEPLPLIQSKGIQAVYLNFEATGLKWFEEDRPLAVAIRYPTVHGWRSQYISWGHTDGNISPDAAREWMQQELDGVHITNINTRFDVHMGRVWGVDFEAMGCGVSDVGHYAALLNDHRMKTNLDTLAWEFLGENKIPRLDESRMAAYPAGVVAPRAMYNVELVQRLRDVMWPMLDDQDLHRVRKLEDEVIYVVCEMEKNGSPIDVELLKSWEVRSAKQVVEIQEKIAHLTGRKLQVDLFGEATKMLNPDSPKEMEELFKQLGLPIERTDSGRPSFSADVLEQYDHPVVTEIRRLSKLLDLRAKYIVGDLKRIGKDGILRYALHQLRATKGDLESAGEAGTIAGRFSSTEITSGVGVNIQQRIKVAKQRVAWGYDEDDSSHDDEIYLIRQLHIPRDPSWKWLSADAMQIEYRLFANEADSPRINKAYEENPRLSFHRMTHAEFKKRLPNLTYRRMKDTNFAKIYAAGPKKIAWMLGHITKKQFVELTESKARNNHPLLAETNELLAVYKREIPEADVLIQQASELARSRGYIRSILGRRCRFPNGQRLHMALNRRIQPTAADLMKMKLVELHKERKDTSFLMRFTVHDEVDGDIPDDHHAKKVAEILDTQSWPFKIPILWDTATGPNWAKCG
jgi:DNA polymerase I-like protein with 3'-5' exonuclease and polymerase domains